MFVIVNIRHWIQDTEEDIYLDAIAFILSYVFAGSMRIFGIYIIILLSNLTIPWGLYSIGTGTNYLAYAKKMAM